MVGESAGKRIAWADFEAVGLRVGTIIKAEPFPEARKPAYKLWVDLGPFGVKKSSAQVTDLYRAEELVGSQVLCVTSFEPKQVANFMSEVLVTGLATDGGVVVLVRPERKVPEGTPLS